MPLFFLVRTPLPRHGIPKAALRRGTEAAYGRGWGMGWKRVGGQLNLRLAYSWDDTEKKVLGGPVLTPFRQWEARGSPGA